MSCFLGMLGHLWNKLYNTFVPDESLVSSKSKWNGLAEKNARYFVLSDQGEQIGEEEFRAAGLRDFERYIAQDSLLLKELAPFASRTVLEIGCGLGRISDPLSTHFQDVTGLDISEEMIRRARQRLGERPNLKLLPTNGVDYPVADGSIDFVFSYIVFQHMPSREVIQGNLREVSRVLKRGGIAKIQLRGLPVRKSRWFYGPSITPTLFRQMTKELPVTVLREEGIGEKYYWVTLRRNS